MIVLSNHGADAPATSGGRKILSAYDEPGTAEEVTRRTFMANATTVMSGLIGLGLAIPILGSLAPPKTSSAGGTWSPLNPTEFKQLQTAAAKPIKLSFTLKVKDSYLPEEATAQYVWGLKTETATFEKARPDLFGKGQPFSAINMGFVIFSPICPHLGCRFEWHGDANKFQCPCHGSQFNLDGTHVAGPAPRGLDPLPLREQSGMAQITWIRYAPNVPDRVVVSYQS